MEPEPTQLNSLDRLHKMLVEINHISVYFSGYTETDPTGKLSPDCLAQESGFVSSRQFGQTPAAVCIGFESCCNGQNVFNRTCLRHAAPLGPDLKPKLWDEIGEKLTLEVSTEIITLLKLVTTYLCT